MALAGTRLAQHPLYAGTTDKRNGRPVFNGKMTSAPEDDDAWSWPVRWRGAKAPKLGAGKPSLIFVGDMADLFHKDRPRAAIDRVISGIVYSKHIGQLLTKRPDVMHDYLFDLLSSTRWHDLDHPLLGKPNFAPEAQHGKAVLPRLWVGASTERQKEFDERWPWLKRLAEFGFTIYVSYEPAMGPLVLPPDFLALGRRAQVIAGGVSGKWPWAPHPDWFRAVRDQCAAAGVAFFFKQWGSWEPRKEWSGHQGGGRFETMKAIMPDGSDCPHDVVPQEVGAHRMAFVGKGAAGATLDGREWREFPS
jgi:protein gp37